MGVTELAVDFRAYAPVWKIKPPRPTGEDELLSVGDQSILRYDFDDEPRGAGAGAAQQQQLPGFAVGGALDSPAKRAVGGGSGCGGGSSSSWLTAACKPLRTMVTTRSSRPGTSLGGGSLHPAFSPTRSMASPTGGGADVAVAAAPPAAVAGRRGAMCPARPARPAIWR